MSYNVQRVIFFGIQDVDFTAHHENPHSRDLDVNNYGPHLVLNDDDMSKYASALTQPLKACHLLARSVHFTLYLAPLIQQLISQNDEWHYQYGFSQVPEL